MFLPYLCAKKEPLRRVFAYLPVIIIVLLAMVKFSLSGLVSAHISGFNLYGWLINEDGVVENCEFVAFFMSFIIALSISRAFFRDGRRLYGLLYLLLSLGLFYVAMEEISWMQRIFHFKTTGYFLQHNYQKEMNTHNILHGRLVHGAYIVIGLFGAFVRLLPLKLKDRHFFAPERYLSWYFLPVAILYFYYDYLRPLELRFLGEGFVYKRFIHNSDQEAAELLLSLGFLIFLTINLYRLSSAESAPLDDLDEERYGLGPV